MDSIDAAFEDLTILKRCMKHIHWFSPGVPGDELLQEPKQCLEYGHSQLFANRLIDPRTITTEVFHDACRLGRANVVESLVEVYRQNPSALQYKNWSSLHTAMAHNQKEVVETLLQLGVQSTRTEDGVYASGLRPELWALCGGEIEVHISRGLNDVYDEYDSDDSEDQYRKECDSKSRIDNIISNIDNLREVQHLPEELWRCQTSVGDLICLLVDNYGIQILYRGSRNARIVGVYENILRSIIKQNNTYSLLRLCVELGVNVTYDSRNLWFAVSKGYYDKTRFLLQHGANPKLVKYDNITLLGRAIQIDQLDIVQLLLNYNVNINESFANGRTALHFAVMYDRINIVRLLLENGADTSLKSTWKGRPMTPLEMVRTDDPETARQMEDLFREFTVEVEEPARKRSRHHV